MNPGRELDHIISTKIFGIDYFDTWKEIETAHPSIRFPPDLPGYSTNIRAAWEVVEKLRSLSQYGGSNSNIDFSIEQKNRLENGKWCVETDCLKPDHNGHFKKVWVHADTAPHAICLAALKAVGCEIDFVSTMNRAVEKFT